MKRRNTTILCGLFLIVLVGAVLLLLAGRKNRDIPLHWENPERGCTVVLVGKHASTDGSTMATHSADCGVCGLGTVS